MAFINFTGKSIWIILSTLGFICGFPLSNAVQFSCGAPRPEVVSIYNNQYNIPLEFGPFFIKINRCIECSFCPYYPLPATTQLVKIVVQNSISGKVYEYTLHNHTSCICGPLSKRKKEHYESTAKEVSLAYKINEKNNPGYIYDCSQPQQRYQKTEDHYYPPFYGYKQCLPMCTTKKSVTKKYPIVRRSGSKKTAKVIHDISCSYPQYSVSNENNHPDAMFNIDSKKTFFALVLLALAFITVIIIDLTFCCRKKGFCYSFTKCMKGEEERPEIQPTLV